MMKNKTWLILLLSFAGVIIALAVAIGFLASQKKALAKASAFFNDVFRKRNVMHTAYVMRASPVMHAVTRVCGTHRITYHSEAASLITCLQNTLICGIIQLDKLEFDDYIITKTRRIYDEYLYYKAVYSIRL